MAKKHLKTEKDSVYFFKLVMYLVFGAMWVHVNIGLTLIPIPLGFMVGLIFASHDHFKVDRRIEFAVLLVSAFIGYLLDPRLLVRI